MGRVLAIDYGQKRVGFAVSDPDNIIAQGLDTVHVTQAFDFIQNYISIEQVETIVVGDPKRMDNTQSESARFIEPFVNRLKDFVNPIVRIDEDSFQK